MNIGVLALQGAFIEHIHMIEKLGSSAFEIRQLKDLDRNIDGIIIPGGESTVIGKLLNDLGMMTKLKTLIENGTPVFGTCAGLILLSKNIENDSKRYISTMDITTVRNAYGRQLGSFKTVSNFKGIGDIEMTFIRAPYITSVKSNVDVLSVVDGHIVAARQDNMLVTAFHPELNDNLSVHKYFLDMIQSK